MTTNVSANIENQLIRCRSNHH